MKIIDLYNKIANGEIKDKTKFRIHFGDMYRDFYYDGSEENQLQCLKNCSDNYSLYDDINLNDEVEIIEDTPKENKKIDRVSLLDVNTDYKLKDILNEIIDKINGE
jgi:hypothetical protein